MYRLKQYSSGWIVEVKKYRWSFFGLKSKWTHVTHWTGLPNEPYYYSTPEKARDFALRKIKDEINNSFR